LELPTTKSKARRQRLGLVDQSMRFHNNIWPLRTRLQVSTLEREVDLDMLRKLPTHPLNLNNKKGIEML